MSILCRLSYACYVQQLFVDEFWKLSFNISATAATFLGTIYIIRRDNI